MRQTRFFSQAVVVACALAVGYAASAIGVPLAWILGPMLVSAIAALSGRGLKESKLVRRSAQVVVGTAVGHGFTASVLLALLWKLPWMGVFALWSLVIAAFCSLLLERWARLDRRTALLANLPGGVAEMAFLGGAAQGASTAISLIQAIRVTSLVILLPFLLTLVLDQAGGTASAPLGGGAFSLATLMVLAVGYGVGWGMDRLGIQNAFIVGALLVSVLDTLSGIAGAAVPNGLFIGAQAAIGLALGSRFERREVARMPRIVAIGLVVSLITSALIIASALAVAMPLGISMPVMTLAGAPGGIAEMMITATTLGLGVAEIVAFQTIRIIVVNFFAGPIAGLWLRVSPALVERSRSRRDL